MRIRISHSTTYAYETPPTGVTQLLRKTPRDHDGQHVLAWRIDISEGPIKITLLRARASAKSGLSER